MEERMTKENFREYYEYIRDQLAFCKMITSVFEDEIGEGCEIPKEIADDCRKLAKQIVENVEII